MIDDKKFGDYLVDEMRKNWKDFLVDDKMRKKLEECLVDDEMRKNWEECLRVKELHIDKGMKWQVKTETDCICHKFYLISITFIELLFKYNIDEMSKRDIYNYILSYLIYKTLISNAVLIE